MIENAVTTATRSRAAEAASAAFVVSAWLLFGAPTTIVQLTAQQPQPPFRGGIELVTVDVSVFDKQGRPVPNLGAADFRVIAGGKSRDLTSLEFIRTASNPGTTSAGDELGPTVSTTPVRAARSESRAFFFVVNVAEIRAGEGRTVFDEVAEYIDGLPATDQVGLLTVPVGARVNLSFDRNMLRTSLQGLAGFSRQLRECAPTLGETAAVDAGDARGTRAYLDRTRHLGCQPGAGFSRLNLAMRRQATQQLIDELSRLAQTMALLEGRKAIVLLSEGLYMDGDIRHAWRDFLSFANKHRVTVYAIHLDFPLTEAGLAGNTTETRLLDDQYGFDGMAEAAVTAGGSVFRAIATAKTVLQRLDTELSGYYLLSFRRERSDEPGKQIKIVVKVRPSGLDVRSRQTFVPGPFIK